MNYEFRTNFVRKSYLIMTFVVPLLLLLVAILLPKLLESGDSAGATEAFENMNVDGPVGLIDRSGEFNPPEAESEFGKIRFYEDEAAAQEALASGTINSYFVIKADYLETGKVYRYAEQFDVTGQLIDEKLLLQNFVTFQMAQASAVEDEARLAAQGISQEDFYYRLVDAANFDTVVIARGADVAQADADEDKAEIGEGAMFLLPYVFGVLIMMGTMIGTGYLMSSIFGDKENRMIEIVLSSVKPFPLLVGKVASSGLLTILQLSIYLLVMRLAAPQLSSHFTDMAGLEVSPELIAITFLYFLGGYFIMSGVYASVASVVERLQDASQFAGFMILPLMLPLMFISEFISAPNGALPVVLSIFPLTAPMGMVMRIATTSVPAGEIALSLGLTALGAVASIWIASRLFRVNTLLSGQTPKLRNLWQLIRENV